MTVPFLDLGRRAAAERAELEDAFATVLSSGRFIGGPALERFEAEFADYCGADHAVGVNSGTDALALALRGLGIGPGDEVITAANTCVATITGIVGAGATPVLADVDGQTWTLDAASARAAVTERTRAIVPVHLYGQCADLDAIGSLGIPVVEDAAEAHGAEYRGKRAGAVGAAGARTASIRPRTSARSATPVRSSPRMQPSPTSCAGCVRTANAPRRAGSPSSPA